MKTHYRVTTLLLILTLSSVSCERLAGPEPVAQLDVQITFPRSTSTVHGKQTVGVSSKTITSMNLSVATPEGRTLFTGPFTKNGTGWEIEVELNPISKVSVGVEAWHDENLIYSGVDTSVAINSGSVAVARIEMKSHLPTAEMSLIVHEYQPLTITADARSSVSFQASYTNLRVRFDWENDSNWDTEFVSMVPRTHSYDAPGEYTVVVEVKDGDGLIAHATQEVVVEAQLPALKTQLKVTPEQGVPGDLFVATVATATVGGDSVDVQTRWDWNGDGSWDTDWIDQTTVAVQLDESGTYNVNVEVSDTQNRTGVAQQDIFVSTEFVPPVAYLSILPLVTGVNRPVIADAGASRACKEGDNDLRYRWDWDGDGAWDTEQIESSSITCEYPHEGTYTVCVEVTDGAGISSVVQGDVLVLSGSQSYTAGHQIDVNGVPMAFIPDGTYLMGSDNSSAADFPPHPVDVSSFLMDVYEVTNAQYQRFVLATDYPAPPHWTGTQYPPEQAELPVVNVSLCDAREYAAWRGARLPTEEEWEYAARGPEGLVFPWGMYFNSANAAHGTMPVAPVGRFPQGASFFGIQDMAGNVYEWTDSKFRPYPGFQEYILVNPATSQYYDDSIYLISDNPFDESNQEEYIMRGGSVGFDYGSNGAELLSTKRQHIDPLRHHGRAGFRCVVDVP
jgi:formylglycine-generating enzyme required for sulfatase activity